MALSHGSQQIHCVVCAYASTLTICESEDFNVIKTVRKNLLQFLAKLCRYFADTTSSIWKKQYMHNLASVARTLRVTCILLSRFPRRHVHCCGFRIQRTDRL